MFCRNCGKEYSEAEGLCPACGIPAGEGQHHCPRCAAPTEAQDAFCTNCGAPLLGEAAPNAAQQPSGGMPPPPSYQTGAHYSNPNGPFYPPQRPLKSKLAAVLLGLFLGGFGIHNFYLGYNDKALWQLVLGILCCGTISWVWAFVEVILILCGSINTDGYGLPLGD